MMLCSLKRQKFMNFLIYNINSRHQRLYWRLSNTAINDFPAEKNVITFWILASCTI